MLSCSLAYEGFTESKTKADEKKNQKPIPLRRPKIKGMEKEEIFDSEEEFEKVESIKKKATVPEPKQPPPALVRPKSSFVPSSAMENAQEASESERNAKLTEV